MNQPVRRPELKAKPTRPRTWIVHPLAFSLAVLLACGALGCSGADDTQNQVPENPAPLPDPSQRIEG